MKPPVNAVVYETPISTHWFDSDGILYGIPKHEERTLENYQKLIDLYRTLMKENDKLCLMSDYNEGLPMSKEVIDFLSRENPKYLKAIAIVSNEPLGAPQVSTFLKHSLSGFPVRKFTSEESAKQWLMEFKEK